MTKRTVIITGGSRGIGAAISEAFYDEGNYVIIAGRTDNGLADKLGSRARFISTDVRHPQALISLVNQAIEWTGRLDVLVNNAGVSGWRPLVQIDETFWQDMLDTNLKSVLFSCQAAVPYLSPGSVIINISSLAGKRGSANNAVYCAAKFGVNGITQSLAKELGPLGIRVNALCPVYVATAGLEEALGDVYAPTGGKDIPAYLTSFAATQSALGVLPTAAQVADACLFLSSSKAGAITGQCINVDCGVLPQ
ncbi:SDR family oxidoreductase [Chlorobium sp. BLA1]|uniref:SDR family NAD(P)-dependent oxidoreductase n=1 Tax=Candidatus Chlorobium masyuteum TaxID=2716876 RepID=UPI001421AF7C|nr:SDR family oxidoreductase [Candidatus Chlorobium masyuteum]NHQ59236.1 SDR family oxidoreductase [Candidatus Chlorobium masyuteum]